MTLSPCLLGAALVLSLTCVNAEHRCGLEIDDQLEPGLRLDGKFVALRTGHMDVPNRSP